MIIIGVDAHKRVHVALAVDEAGREIGDWRGPNSADGWISLARWASMFGLSAHIAFGAQMDTTALAIAGVAVGAVLVRYAIVLKDNSTLNRELVLAEQALEVKVGERTAELSRLVSILEATTDFVGTFDRAGNIQYLNRAGRAILHLGEGELASKRLPDLFPPWACTLVEQQAVPAALAVGSWKGESALRTSGSELPVSQVVLAHHPAGDSEQYFSTIARDISERKQLEAQLRHLANHDALTNLFNRRRFEEELQHEMSKVKRFRQQAAVLFIDLDHFKYVNDTLGHHAGDQVLANLGQVLLSELRDTDVLARLGGDEFGVLLSHTDRSEAEGVAGRLVGAIRNHRIDLDGELVGITGSIGVALAPEHGTVAGELLARSDSAMYRAKEERDSFCLYSPEHVPEISSSNQLIWEGKIREALSQDRLVLVAQPIRGLQTDELRFELLLRMADPDGRLLPPSEFLSTAEQTGLIHAIDRWVAREAIAVVAACQRRGDYTCFEANLSARAFLDDDLLPLIRDELQRLEVDARSLIFEVTETAAIANLATARGFLESLRALGCGTALDDFGVGYSSLAHLKNLPVDYLKIDGSFIRNLPRDASDQHMVRSVVELARGLGKQTVAEWVGDEATVELLREMGVDFGQGYHLGVPSLLEDVLGLSREARGKAA